MVSVFSNVFVICKIDCGDCFGKYVSSTCTSICTYSCIISDFNCGGNEKLISNVFVNCKIDCAVVFWDASLQGELHWYFLSFLYFLLSIY